MLSLTICSSESWPGSFIAGTAPSFSIKRCANPVLNWALFIKRSSTKHLRNSIAAPEKQTISTVPVTVGSFGKLNKVIFSSQPKTHFFRDILPERVPCCQPADWRKLSFSLWSMPARARSSGRNAHIRSSTVVYVIKNNDRKKLSKTCTNPEERFLAQKYSVIRPKNFFLTLSMLSMRIQLFNSVNNSECMKQHCTPPLIRFHVCVWLCVYYPVYLSPVCWVQCGLVYSLFPVSLSVYLALSYLDVVIKDYYFEVSPRLRVPRFSVLCAPWHYNSP